MFHGNPYDNVMIEAVHELDHDLRTRPLRVHLNPLRWISAYLRQRRALIRLSLPDNSYPKVVLIEEDC
jgi:hypothetical protein